MNHLRLVYSRPKVTPYLVNVAAASLGAVIWVTVVTFICAVSVLNMLPHDDA